MRHRNPKYDDELIRKDAYPEFDLAYQPHSYADVADPVSAIHGIGTDDDLPPLLPGEITIVRITYHTVVPHEVEIRARPAEDGFYRYRIVDGPGTLHVPILDRSKRPLSLRQLVELIEESHGITGDPGLVEPVLDAVFPPGPQGPLEPKETPGDRRARMDAIRGFVHVRSEIYVELEEFFQLKTDEWLVERGYLEETSRRSVHRARKALAAEREKAPLEAEIDRLLRSWWLTHESSFSDEEGIELGSRALQLRRFVREYVNRHGKLPVGEVRTGPEADGARRRVDLNRLMPTEVLLERMLAEGEVLDPAEIEGWPFDPEYVSVYRFGDSVYIAHPEDVDGPFDEEFFDEYSLSEYFHEYLHDHARLVAQLDWDSGGPGAGAGISYVYRAFGALYVSDDFGLSEPYDDYEHAVRHHGIYTVNDATTRIWDEEHGLVFERGVLYKPEAVERYGDFYVDPSSLAPAPGSDPSPPAGTSQRT